MQTTTDLSTTTICLLLSLFLSPSLCSAAPKGPIGKQRRAGRMAGEKGYRDFVLGLVLT